MKFTVREKFEHEKFCDPSKSTDICKRALENKYFKTEKLSYVKNQHGSENECQLLQYKVHLSDSTKTVNFRIKFKICEALKDNADHTKSLVRVYLQSAYKQPWIGRWKFFVRFPFIHNSASGRWERNLDPTTPPENLEYRIEAYLSL